MRLRPPRPAPAARVAGTRPPGLLAEKIGGIAFLQLLCPALRVTAQPLALPALRGLARLVLPGSHARQRSGSGRYFPTGTRPSFPAGAGNLCHLAGCSADRWLPGPASIVNAGAAMDRAVFGVSGLALRGSGGILLSWVGVHGGSRRGESQPQPAAEEGHGASAPPQEAGGGPGLVAGPAESSVAAGARRDRGERGG